MIKTKPHYPFVRITHKVCGFDGTFIFRIRGVAFRRPICGQDILVTIQNYEDSNIWSRGVHEL